MAGKQIHCIASVDAGSVAEKYDIKPGDCLLSINGQEIEDVFDYRFLVQEEKLTVCLQGEDGVVRECRICKDTYEDLGVQFENEFMSEYHSCSNKCIFCFIDQMPPGMRDTLYFKDDDSRLSFLQGNYITLTNMQEKDVERMIRYHLAPVNISVHTTNPELRCKMLNNRFAGKSLEILQRFYDAGLSMNGQIVLCPGVNDGEELRRTLQDLCKFAPVMRSVSVVPAGLTKYREGLYPLQPVSAELARQTIDMIEAVQEEMYERHGLHFVHASDELYILAGRPMPEEERYDGYVQLENGVGMIRLQSEEVRMALKNKLKTYMRRHPLSARNVMVSEKRQIQFPKVSYEISLATGQLAAPYMRKYAAWFCKYFPGVTIHVYDIRNDFFGEQITVAGLITGQDLIAQLKDKPLGDTLLLPACMFRSGEKVFLDDITLEEVEKTLQVSVHIVKSSGQDLIDGFCMGRKALGRAWDMCKKDALHKPYELDSVYETEE